MSITSSCSSRGTASKAGGSFCTQMMSADDWFASGQRVCYDLQSKTIRSMPSKRNHHNNNNNNNNNTGSHSNNQIAVWERTYIPKGNPLPSRTTRWMTMLPGFPEGSMGFAKLDPYLNDTFPGVESSKKEDNRIKTPRLYLDYVGQGDSDTPPAASCAAVFGGSNGGSRHRRQQHQQQQQQQQQQGYPYGTKERADMVQALWRARGVHRTVVVAVDYSAMVVVELLRRQEEELRMSADLSSCSTLIEHVLIINGMDLLSSPAAIQVIKPNNNKTVSAAKSSSFARAVTTSLARHSNMIIKSMLQRNFSTSYRTGCQKEGMKEEVRQVIRGIRRHGGATALARAAANIATEQQQEGDRWNLVRIWRETSLQARGVTIQLVESGEDQRDRDDTASVSCLFMPSASLERQEGHQQGTDTYASRQLSLERIRGGHFILLERPCKVATLIHRLSLKHDLTAPVCTDTEDGRARPFWRFPATAA